MRGIPSLRGTGGIPLESTLQRARSSVACLDPTPCDRGRRLARRDRRAEVPCGYSPGAESETRLFRVRGGTHDRKCSVACSHRNQQCLGTFLWNGQIVFHECGNVPTNRFLDVRDRLLSCSTLRHATGQTQTLSDPVAILPRSNHNLSQLGLHRINHSSRCVGKRESNRWAQAGKPYSIRSRIISTRRAPSSVNSASMRLIAELWVRRGEPLTHILAVVPNELRRRDYSHQPFGTLALGDGQTHPAFECCFRHHTVLKLSRRCSLRKDSRH